MNYSQICKELNEKENTLLDEFANYAPTIEKTFDLFRQGDENYRLDEIIHEIADNMVNVYTYQRFEWALANIDLIQEYEEEVNDLNVKPSVEQIIASCWYLSNIADLKALAEKIHDKLKA